jgi:hypothetical protein
MSYTYQDINNLIETNLANSTSITAAEHRQLEHAFLDFTNDRLNAIERKLSIFQAGGVVFPWFKSTIPDGFREVTDMRGKTIFGYDPTQAEFNSLGASRGNKTHTLTIAQMPAHTHDVTFPLGDDSASSGNHSKSRADRNKTATSSSSGGGQSFPILNPYKVAIYIEFIG